MAHDTVTHHLENMDELDFTGWNRANWKACSLAITPTTFS